MDIVVKEKRSRYVYNVATLKQYGNRYKVTWNASELSKGVTVERRQRGTNTDKLDNNIRRAKNKIKEYALCNEWDYFVTLTLDKTKQDRYDIKDYIKRLGKMINNLNSRTHANIEYVLIPEQHKDGAWHMHGLIRGIPREALVKAHKGNRKREVYNWTIYSEKFGFSDLEPVEDREKVASYITKYVTKEMTKSIKEMNAKSYYASKGLQTSKVIKKGTVSSKYEPQYIKEISDNVVYSEMWLPTNITLQQALTYLDDKSWSSICQDGELVEDVPLEWL